jgi:hypothetical protein
LRGEVPTRPVGAHPETTLLVVEPGQFAPVTLPKKAGSKKLSGFPRSIVNAPEPTTSGRSTNWLNPLKSCVVLP